MNCLGCPSLRLYRGLAVLALAASVASQGVQPNSSAASLLVQGQAGAQNVLQGDVIHGHLSGAPNSLVALVLGQPLVPGAPTPGGFLNLATFGVWLVDGLTNPALKTDANGNWTGEWPVPWAVPSGVAITTQGAVGDTSSPIGLTLTAPSSLTVTANTLSPAHLFFDPTLAAKGVESILPPAGTLPGDLPTLDPNGYPGPTGIFDNGEPVHGVFQTPYYCYACHGGAADIWPSYMGTMMANAMRDPLFNGQFAVSVAGYEYLNQQGVTNFGGDLIADFCIRCHGPNAWQGGRSGFEGDGTTTAYTPGVYDQQHALDMEGVVCDACHRTTGFAANVSPSRFKTPGQPDTSQLVISHATGKRGPYPGTYAYSHLGGTTAYGAHIGPTTGTTVPPVAHNPPTQSGSAVSPGHDTQHGANLGESTLCGTCHNITHPESGHAVERTYTEWLNSDYSDPSSPDHQSCQDCHMPAQSNVMGCTLGGQDPQYGAWNKVRSALRQHEFVGGNAWIPQILKQMYPNVDLPWTNGNNYQGTYHFGPPSRNALYDTVTTRATNKLKIAADLDLTAIEATPGTITASVTVTNLSGHKLPTGYPEGRQMWIQIEALDAGGAPFWQSGILDGNNELIADPDLKVYEARQGLNYPSLGLSGESFHFALNNMVVKDNRIPPKGATLIKGIGGTDAYDPNLAPWPSGGLYPDNQHWDTTVYQIPIPAGTARPIKVRTSVLYQTASFAYVDFLANGGDSVVQTTPHPDAVTVRSLWLSGYPAPAVPVGMVGVGSTADPNGPYVGQTAMVIIP